jgi:hypothetical protein
MLRMSQEFWQNAAKKQSFSPSLIGVTLAEIAEPFTRL